MRKKVFVLSCAVMLIAACGGDDSGSLSSFAGEESGIGDETASEEKGVHTTNAPLTGDTVAVDAGFASDGVFINIPSGFVASQCKFTAAAATIDGNATSIYVSINETTGEVVCEKVVQEREEIPPETQGCVASYTVICVQ